MPQSVRRRVPVRAVALLIAASATLANGARAAADAGPTGADISWPQCPTGAHPDGPPTFAVIGVTGGQPFTVNPCLSAEFAWARTSAAAPTLYVNLNLPPVLPPEQSAIGPYGACSTNDLGCAAANYGYNTVLYALLYAAAQGVSATLWWLDVEIADYWSDNTAMNVRVIAGAIRALNDHGETPGAYSTFPQWDQITGGSRPGIAAWAAGPNGPDDASAWCVPWASFTGGPVLMTQYLVGEFDSDVICLPAGAALLTPRQVELFERLGPPPPRAAGSDSALITRTPPDAQGPHPDGTIGR